MFYIFHVGTPKKVIKTTYNEFYIIEIHLIFLNSVIRKNKDNKIKVIFKSSDKYHMNLIFRLFNMNQNIAIPFHLLDKFLITV